MFLDDPSEFIISMEAEWPGYIERDAELEQSVEKSVVEWRLANDAMLIPEHPLWRTINTRESNGYWVAQPVQWVDSVEKEFDSVRHGIDV